MIHANRIVTVGDQESIIDRPIVLYRGDREVEIEFTLVGNEFTFSEEGNVIKSVNASHGQLVLNTPSGEHMFSELAECQEGKVVFVVTKEMIDEFIEMGFYSFQIRLYDSAEMKSRVTIPPVMNGFDIRNPIAAEDETNVVDQGIVDYARIFKDQSNEELSTFTWDGEYVKTEWVHHDVITENKLNKIEDALYSINANVKESDVVMLNTLDQVKKDADAYVKEHMAEVEADVDEFERNLNTDVQQFKIDTNAAMTAHKNEVSEELEGFSSQLAYKANKDSMYLNVLDFGASSENTNEQNKLCIQNAILRANEIGCGVVFIPSNISYGYNRNDISTHPNFDDVDKRIMVIDYSEGATYSDQETSRDGSQCRYFFNTEGDETDAQHDGNGIIVRGKWHPYIMISNDGENTNNRRATYFIANKGVATWGIGQGVNTIEGGSDDELSHFKIMGNKVNNSEGFTTCYCIDKETGMMAWNTSQPKNDFDFIFKNNNTMRLKRSTDGNVFLVFETNDGKTRKIVFRDDNDTLNFTNSSGGSNVFVLSDSGEGKFSNGVTGGVFNSSSRPSSCSPGTMIFDTTLKKPLWYYGGSWYDSTGQTV